MASYKALFHLLILFYVIPLLDIVSQLTTETLHTKVNGDAICGGGLGCNDVGGGTEMEVSSLRGCLDAEKSRLGLTDPKQKDSNIVSQLKAADAAALTELADKVSKCVRSAEATLEWIEKDSKAANAVVVAYTASLKNALATADAAKTTAWKAESKLRQMKALADQIVKRLAYEKKMANEAQAQLEEHKQLLKVAKMRVANATRRVADAQADFDNTKEAAIKAARQSATAHRALLQHSAQMNQTGYLVLI